MQAPGGTDVLHIEERPIPIATSGRVLVHIRQDVFSTNSSGESRLD